MQEFYKKGITDRSEVEIYDRKSEEDFLSVLQKSNYTKDVDFKIEPEIEGKNSQPDFVFGKIEYGKIIKTSFIFEVKNISVIEEDVEKFEGIIEIKPHERLRRSISKAVRSPKNDENNKTKNRKAGNLFEFMNEDCYKIPVIYNYLSLAKLNSMNLLEAVYGVHVLESFYDVNTENIYVHHTLSKKQDYIEGGMFRENINNNISGFLYVGVPENAKYIELANPEQFEYLYIENIYCEKKFDIVSFLKNSKIKIIKYKEGAFYNDQDEFIIEYVK